MTRCYHPANIGQPEAQCGTAAGRCSEASSIRQEGGSGAQASCDAEDEWHGTAHAICYPDDYLRGRYPGSGVARQRLWFSGDGASHDAGRKALARRDARRPRVDQALCLPRPNTAAQARHREVCDQARRWSAVPWIIDGVLVYVDHLERHLARAKSAGATILSEIEDGPPGRRYRAEDLEGHRWFFFEKDDG